MGPKPGTVTVVPSHDYTNLSYLYKKKHISAEEQEAYYSLSFSSEKASSCIAGTHIVCFFLFLGSKKGK